PGGSASALWCFTQRVTRWAPVALAVLLTAAGHVSPQGTRQATERRDPQQVLAPGWKPLGYAPPVPGTYELPPLGVASDGRVLDSAGKARRLYKLFGDKVVILSFIYTRCPDVNKCPMATYVLSRVQKRLLDAPALGARVRLMTMSFDPEHDRPDVMRAYSAGVTRNGADWQFLTAESPQSLAPILRAYGQSVKREYDANGKPLGTISHILRVYLIDPGKRIRNIYAASFLHADTVLSDIQTVLNGREQHAEHRFRRVTAPDAPALGAAGEDKHGSARRDDDRRSKHLAARPGRAIDLLRFYTDPPLGLPEVPASRGNPVTAKKVALGRKLFFDRRLSRNNTISCAMCHVPEQGFTSNELATAVGIEGQTVRRNAPTLYNVAFATLLFHDGRESRLEQQVWGPLLAANEMGNPSIGYVLDKIERLPGYRALFKAAFDDRRATMETVGMALASYERMLLSANSAFDRWYFGKEEGALSPAAKRGFQLFRGKARCANCHEVADGSALFTDQGLHNTGIGYRQTMGAPLQTEKLQVAPGTFLSFDPAVIAASAERPLHDLGRYEITGDPDDRWKYKTPTLRNIALTAPYMHNGSLGTLRDVVDFYNRGGIANELRDPLIQPLGLSEGEIGDLVAFLRSLTGDNVGAIVADALAVPVGDPR
ncbi:MAG: cytochrome c peroxidase, partial [Candidatus Binatia bacterium]